MDILKGFILKGFILKGFILKGFILKSYQKQFQTTQQEELTLGREMCFSPYKTGSR